MEGREKEKETEDVKFSCYRLKKQKLNKVTW